MMCFPDIGTPGLKHNKMLCKNIYSYGDRPETAPTLKNVKLRHLTDRIDLPGSNHLQQ